MIFRIPRNAVKEGFDTLPAAICYFDRNGLLRLINHRMQEIAAVLYGRDLQTLTDLEQALHSPGGGAAGFVRGAHQADPEGCGQALFAFEA